MAHFDAFGLALTLDSAEAVADWNATVHGVLAHSAATPCALAAVREKAPDFALGHAMRGLCCLILGRGELVAIAAHDLANAKAELAARPASRRETLYAEALQAWLAGQPSWAATILDDLLESWPDDALAAKIGHSIRFMMGDIEGMRSSIERVVGRASPDNPAAGYLRGCLAFALEETGDLAAAEREGRAAVEMAPDDVWGLHAVDHVFDMIGRPADGIAWMTAQQAAFGGANNFRFHLWWHLALHHLDLGEIDRVLDLYDTEIRAERTDDFRDFANAASLLARLECDGHDVGCRWQELADIAARRVDDSSLVFASAHYLMALLAAGRGAQARALVRRIAADAARGESEMDLVARRAGVPLAEGLEAFWSGNTQGALVRLLAASHALPAIGGSHAQRDVFARLTIEAAIRAGEAQRAQRLIEARSQARGGNDGYARARAKIAGRRPPASRGAAPARPHPA